MNRDDLIRMVGASKVEEIFVDMGDGRALFSMSMEGLERFAQLVAAHEREAMAKLCDKMALDAPFVEDQSACEDCAAAIRARGAA